MIKILIIIFVLSGCATAVVEEVDLSNVPHLKMDDWSMWLPMVKKAPDYPDNLVRRRIEGCVNVQYVIRACSH